jgi:hypothetical protein
VNNPRAIPKFRKMVGGIIGGATVFESSMGFNRRKMEYPRAVMPIMPAERAVPRTRAPIADEHRRRSARGVRRRVLGQ